MCTTSMVLWRWLSDIALACHLLYKGCHLGLLILELLLKVVCQVHHLFLEVFTAGGELLVEGLHVLVCSLWLVEVC